MSYDNILEKVGGDNFHWRMLIVLFLNGIPNVLNVALLAFIHYIPDSYRCAFPNPVPEFLLQNPSSMNETLAFFIPLEEKTIDHCKVYNTTTEDISSFLSSIMYKNNTHRHRATIRNNQTINCPNGHDYSNRHGIYSASMEFRWVCDSDWIKPIVTSLYMGGLALGAFTGFLSDRYGRRPVINISTLALFALMMLLSFSNSTPMYAVLLFLNGFTALLNYTAAFVLGVECTGPEKRNFLSISSFLSYSFGYGITAFIAYWLPDWRWVLRVSSLIGILFIANIWLIPESPRWLMANGRTDDATRVLKMIARYNNKLECIEELEADVKKESEALLKEKQKDYTVNHEDKKIRKLMWDTLKSPAMMRICLVVFFSWFCAALVYYGISLNVQSFSGDLYINGTLMGLVEIPGLLAAYFVIKYLSRPLSHAGMMIFSGVFCMVAAFFSNPSPVVSSACGFIGKALNAGAFYVVYMHSAEIFPTLTRNTYVSLGSFAGRFGSILSPYFIYMGDLYGEVVPYLAMGLITIASGLLTFVFTPESRLTELPETIEDTLELDVLFNRCCGKKKSKVTKQAREMVLIGREEEEMLTARTDIS